MKNIVRLLLILVLMALFGVYLAAQTGHFRQEGTASVYGTLFQGRPTASGDIYDPNLFTAAQTTLHFGSVLRVTNVHTMQSVTVIVNDRGPFSPSGGIIELSRAAAHAIGMIGPTAHVILEQVAAHHPPKAQSPVTVHRAPPPPVVINSNPPPPVIIHQAPPLEVPATVTRQVPIPGLEIMPPTAPLVAPVITHGPDLTAHAFNPGPPARLTGVTIDPRASSLYRLRVGTYYNPENAINAFNRLRGSGLQAYYEPMGESYRVVLPFVRAQDIPIIAQTLGNLGFLEAFVQVETHR